MNLSKRAIQILIEPWDAAVDKAKRTVDSLDPTLLKNVVKIIVHSGGGAGQLGHVQMGPGKNPQEIHIFKDRIREHVVKNSTNSNKQTLTTQELEQAIVNGLIEVLAHEASHITKTKTPEQIQTTPFAGEPEAEAGARTIMQRFQQRQSNKEFNISKRAEKRTNKNEIILDATLLLNDIKKKFSNRKDIIEPDLEFITHVANNNKDKIIKKAIELIENVNTNNINDVIEYNKVNFNIGKLGALSYALNYNPCHFALEVAKFQEKNNLNTTGKLDNDTFKKLSYNNLPRNFSTVVPNLYRGGIIANDNEMNAIKALGIERVVALHPNPDVARLCNKFQLEYVPAYIENGGPSDRGRKIFGNSVSDYLTQKPTYVHCYFGQDRTGGVIARFRTENGWPCELAYKEAKAFGFQDIFVDLIDWFSEPCGKKPVDTDKIRKLMKNQKPYINPEVTEQKCDIPTPAPNDVPFPGSPVGSYTDYITSPVPTGMASIPVGLGGGYV
jgi:hypothetical protein